jgi:glycosyltransferase involved in cell wall biosynthesis
LNEARSIGICVKKARTAFHEAGVLGEVVVADNGSSDGSIAEAEKEGARVVHVAQKGYGSALRAGIESAQGKFIIMGDADDSYDFLEVPRFIAKWREGNEVVLGNRFGGEIKKGAMPLLHKYLGNPALTAILNLFFGAGIGDVYCGMRGFTPELYRRLDMRTTGMEFAVEFVLKSAKMGAKLAEIPITLWPDKRGRAPHLRSFPDGWRTLRLMLLWAPNWLFLLPGGLLATLGMFLVLWLFPGPRQVGPVVFDLHTMVFGMLFVLLGMQIISIGLFAKVFSYAENLARSERSFEGWLRRVKLEHGLGAGILLAFLGLAGDAWVFGRWAASGFGPLEEMRMVIVSSLCFFVGVQIVFSSFFISMLGISRDTYIGDYETK